MRNSSRFAVLVASLSLVAACGAPAPEPQVPEAPAASAPAKTEGAPGPEVAPPAAGAGPEAVPAEGKPSENKPAPGAAVTIEVPIEARSNSKLNGKATFAEVDGGVKVTIQIAGAPPGKIATHVHETGDCTAPDAKSAGGHFNPENNPHGLPDAAKRHLGDLGNIDVKPDGTGAHEITVKGANLKPNDPSSYLGRALIVHEKKDDGGQPVGNAGNRIGCAVIAPKK